MALSYLFFLLETVKCNDNFRDWKQCERVTNVLHASSW